MNIQELFGLSILGSFLAFGWVTWFYVWPRLKVMERNDALRVLVVPHTFRFIGLSFLVPGVVSPSLPNAFAAPAAYGDLGAVILAFVAAIGLYKRWSSATLLVWVFNVWGAADFLFAYYEGLLGTTLNAGDLGAAFYIPTVFVPAAFITHGLIFRILARSSRSNI